jgi:enoyl-CoA hydratase/carnithine racemase
MSDVLLYEVADAVATITLNRPEQLNALNRELSDAYLEALQRARRDDAVRVVVVTGAGRAFCAGVDLKARAANEASGPAPNFFAMLRGESQYDALMEKPLIAAINGYCLAGGLELALTCDLRIAAEGSRFGMPEIRRGFFPGGGGPQRLPRMVPQALALEMLLTGDQYDATEMHRWGLVNRVVPPEQLLPEALSLAKQIAGHAPLAVRALKELFYTGTEMPLPQALRYGSGLRWIIGQTEDAKEGPRAFAEKREPEYRGR